MNPIVIALEVLLVGLLGAVLVFGVRLERKLKALRASQADFESAIRDLDGAALRTESGLGALRQATEEARTVLTQRTEAAQQMALRLEALTSDAGAAALRAEAAASGAARAAQQIVDVAARSVEEVREASVRLIVAAEPAPPAPRYERRPELEPPAAPLSFPPLAAREPEPGLSPAGSRLRQAAALLRGGR